MPSEYTTEVGFRNHLSSLLRNYEKLLKELDEKDRLEDWDDIIKQVSTVSGIIKEVVKRVYQGRHSYAFNLFKLIPEKIRTYKIIVDDSKWYRMRKMEEKDNVKCKDLFHIPLDKRGIVKNQRYSASGYPCLYLGESIYTCWEEMNRPALNRCFVSQFIAEKKSEKTFTFVFDMSCPSFEMWGKEEIEATNMWVSYNLKRLPLVIASMIRVNNPDDIFKPEYIIPQFVMEYILNQQYVKKKKDPGVKGVIFTSVHQNDDFSFSYNDDNNDMPSYEYPHMQNLAIPIQNPLKGKFCKGLSDMFLMTAPTCYEFEQAKSSFSSSIVKSDDEKSGKYQYEVSIFGLLENRLSDKNRFPPEKFEDK